MESRPRLHLLVVSPYAAYPPVGGGKMRIYHLLQEWMRLGHEVTLWVVPPDEPELDWSNGGPWPQLLALPALVRRSMRSKVSALLSPLPEEVWTRPLMGIDRRREQLRRFDVVLLMQAHVGRYATPFIEAGVPVILDQQNVESQISGEVARLAPTRMGRARARLDVWKWRAYERGLVRSVQRTIAVSEADALAFRKLVPSASVTVRPSGADLRSLHYVDHAENRADRLIMTGTLGYLPNLDAATWMIERILPRVRRVRSSARLVLVGASAPESLRKRGGDAVDIVGRVPDVRPFLEGADLFVAPLRAGGGTRLKLLEAFAVGLPTVATTVASAGIAVRHGSDVAIADDEETFAKEIIRLLDDVSARRAMAESARRLVEERYDWRTIAADYQKDLYDVVRASQTPRSESGPPGASI
jgi:glycosyltransferase involved in cell wall biosynthesis